MENLIMAGIFFGLGILVSIIVGHRYGGKKLKEAAEQMQEKENLHRAEKMNSCSAEEKWKEMGKISHDFNNQLAAAYRLIQRGEEERARELLDEMRDKIAENQEKDIYCGNGVVNAVLLEKILICREKGIELRQELDSLGEVPIQPIHLCSIFSNLLDNGIQAAGQCREGERFLKVQASRRGDYLLVKAENTVPEKTENFIREEAEKVIFGKGGYGHKILKEIAELYDGNFWTSRGDGVYTACISLLLKQE